MPTAYEIHCPANIDEVEMHNWNFEIRFDNGDIGNFDRYADTREMLSWCYDNMDEKLDIIRITIWCDLEWWGEMERR